MKMAVDLIIEAEGFLSNQELDFQDFLKNTALYFGSYNPFFVLEEAEFGDLGLLFNPQAMGRGIYFDGREMNQGKVHLSFNLPTTAREIEDAFNAVSEIKRQYRNISLKCEGKVITLPDLWAKKDYYTDYSMTTLRRLCETKEYEAAILTLASFPYTLTPDEMDFFALEGNLDDFEALIHQKQADSAVYLCPKIMKKDDTNEIVAFYTMAEDCPCILPVECNCFMSLEHVEIHYGLVRFYIDSQKKVLPGYYDYEKVVDYLLAHGATYFDGDHISVPAYSLADFVLMAKEINAKSAEENS